MQPYPAFYIWEGRTMSARLTRGLVPALVLAGAVTLGACGGDDNGGGGGGTAKGTPVKGKQGGTLTVLYAGDVDNIDPGITYYQYGFNVAYTLQRPLYSFKPADSKSSPDLAAGPAQISSDGKTVTVKIKTGVKFSPPVSREVTTKDVKY